MHNFAGHIAPNESRQLFSPANYVTKGDCKHLQMK